MNPKLSDDTVAGLPLSLGRAELLEEIMSTPVLDDRPAPTVRDERRPRGWLVPAAAAAVVAVLAAGTAWWAGSTGRAPESTPPVAAVPEPGSFRVVLDAPGWTIESAYEDSKNHSGEVGYVRGDASLQVNWYPASNYEDRFEDRRHITDPPSDGTPVEVLGLTGSMWAYSADDHTTILPVEERHFLEVRGSGMDQEEYLALLGQLRPVDVAGFDAALPEEFVAQSERGDAIGAILDEIAATAGRALPAGVSRSSVSSDQSDPYQLGAEVTGQVACAWVRQYAEARDAGDQDLAQQAVDVMATSRDWPVLDRMDRTGDWPESIWEISDRIAAGDVPEDYTQWLGCER
ncbi:hypothetical protein [Nocardioides sp.]|uniref:hypothetical protein n=1 Tax=Nocardioides sp. TaxID=35761 RepID=UPI0025E2BC5F|nr:hypothetical protein [Nocardioides sp.]